ncbi:tRNA uracil 4-sulfurtransferase ThiI [Oceanobacillus sp. CAU 1775]
MIYDHILIRYGEMSLKGKNIRSFIVKLQENLQAKLKIFPGVKVSRTQGRMFILLNGNDPDPIMDICKQVFGIQSLSLAIKVENDIEKIKEAALIALNKGDNINTFKISTKRVNKGFPFTTQEINQQLGTHLLVNTEDITVDVHEPDIEIKIEIRGEATYITSRNERGAGGLPVGTSGKSLLLLSGGIDSPVAGYLAMKRGVQLEAIHFHSPPYTSERAKQKVIDLSRKLTEYGRPIKVHIVPFTKLQQEIFREMPDSYAMTIMRRMMFRIAEAVCENEKILSLTTGENLGQVASQTMESMHAINQVTNYPVIRPLIAMDKQDVINMAQEIGTYETSILPYEDCCTIFVPKSPKTKPRVDKVNQYESTYDFTASIEEAIEGIETIQITSKKEQESFEELF